MSKSLGNYIGLTESPRDMFGKSMSIPDTLMVRYAQYACFASADELRTLEQGLADGSVHPRNAKVDIAKRIVARYHGQAAADEAFAEFERVFVNKDVPAEMPTFQAISNTEPLIDFLVNQQLAKSKTEARTLIKQGSVQLDGSKVLDLEHVIDCSTERVLRVGKLRFLRILPV